MAILEIDLPDRNYNFFNFEYEPEISIFRITFWYLQQESSEAKRREILEKVKVDPSVKTIFGPQ